MVAAPDAIVTTCQRALHDKLEAGELVLCLSLSQARTVDIPMMAAAAGYDAIYVDLEHTAISLETTAMLCTASIGFGLVPLVRVPSHDHHYMTRVIDTGAMGMIVPHVDTREQAQHIVDTCKFPPVGHRSISGTNPVTHYRPMAPAEAVEILNAETILCAMVETPEAIERVDEIASVPGLDMVLVGTHDLTAEMGILGQFRHERFLERDRSGRQVVPRAREGHGRGGHQRRRPPGRFRGARPPLHQRRNRRRLLHGSGRGTGVEAARHSRAESTRMTTTLTPIHPEQVNDPMAWVGTDFGSKDELAFDLSAHNVAALEAILARTAHLERDDIGRADAVHPDLDADCAGSTTTCCAGKGWRSCGASR